MNYNNIQPETYIPTQDMSNSGDKKTIEVCLLDNGVLFKYENKSFVSPNLILLEGEVYEFTFDDCDVVLKLLDDNEESYVDLYKENFRLEPSSVFPRELKYEIKTTDQKIFFGNIHIRTPNKINGIVSGYGLLNRSEIHGNGFFAKTNELGAFLGHFPNLENIFYENLVSNSGCDYVTGEETNFRLKTPPGCLQINSLTTLAEFYLNKNNYLFGYNDVRIEILRYFGLPTDFDFFTKSVVKSYFTGIIDERTISKYFILTFLIEKFTIDQKEGALFEIICDDMKNNYFDFYHPTRILSKLRVSDEFMQLFNMMSLKILSLRNIGEKKECFFQNMSATLLCFREVLKHNLNYQQLLSTYSSLYILKHNSINIPVHHRRFLLEAVKSTSVASIGKFAKVNIDSNFLLKTQNQTLPVEADIVNKDLGKTLRIGNSLDSYCYKIVDLIFYDDEDIPFLNLEIMDAHDTEFNCCSKQTKSEDIVNVPVQTMPTSQEHDILELNLIEGTGGGLMFSEKITNANYPFESLSSSSYKVYLNENLKPGINNDTTPSYILLRKTDAINLDKKNIKVSYNSNVGLNIVTNVRYGYEEISILSTFMESDGALNLITSHDHGYKTGQMLKIKNSSKNGVIDGEYKIIGTNQRSITIEFYLNSFIGLSNLSGVTAKIESLKFTKLYTNVRELSVNDKVVFPLNIGDGVPYNIDIISSDEYGDYIAVNSFLPHEIKKFSRSHTQTNEDDIIEFEYESSVAYYDVLNVNPQTHLLWITTHPDLKSGGRHSDIVSSIEFYFNPTTTQTDTSTTSVVTSSTINLKTGLNEILTEKLSQQKEIMSVYDLKKKDNLELDKILNPPTNRVTISEISEKNEIQSDPLDFDLITSDWNQDGDINDDEVRILERYLLLQPSNLAEYMFDRGGFPPTEKLPNQITAQYACRELCCHDDFTDNKCIMLDDVYIYDAFQMYVDALGDELPGSVENFIEFYKCLVKQGLLPELKDEVIYMPTDPREYKRCADYSGSGRIDSDDVHIYYAYYLYMARGFPIRESSVSIANEKSLDDKLNITESNSPTLDNKSCVDEITDFYYYYENLVKYGIVPSLVNHINTLPSLQEEEYIKSFIGCIPKECDGVNWQDLLILNEWIRLGKPSSIEEFNKRKNPKIPCACALPIEEYENIGVGDYYLNEYSGIENL